MKIGRCGFQVAMITPDTRIIKFLQGFFCKKSHGCAQEQTCPFADIPVDICHLFQSRSRYGASASHKGKSLHAFRFAIFGLLHAEISVYNRIGADVRMIMSGLCTPFAVFRAFAGTGIDDRAGIESRTAEIFRQRFSSSVQICLAFLRETHRLIKGYRVPCFNFLKCILYECFHKGYVFPF